MEYKGKLYGKVHKSYFPLIETTEDVDRLREADQIVRRLAELEDADGFNLATEQALNYVTQNPK